ncbi:hypothetical protein MSAR_01890 [Mycolicibacterium sarraceniae]|uniref:Uncharacterized protein n=1 Tax=Mycolicibacterium sarraceniae TaxID=1534348 RepID=A0A7I7SJX2_9MYCO|nr:hypothetical protein MSAR_01890 [Mycolicibacterium sarraceniae]
MSRWSGRDRCEQRDDYLGALSIEIDAPPYDRLDQVSRVEPGEPCGKLADNAAPRGGEDATIHFHPVLAGSTVSPV